MPIHVVGFKDIIRFEGNTPVKHGRELLHEYYDTASYKELKAGDFEVPYINRPHEVWDFVEAKPFIADLNVSTENSYGAKTVTLYDVKHDTYYPMFLQDFIAMASQAIIVRGRVTGRFGFVKKNKNFGINYLGEM